MDNVIVVVVIESKKIRMMLLSGSRGTFPSRVVVASFARCQGKSIERMFLWYGMGVFLCVCVVFGFVCLFETQLLTGHHCQMWFLLKSLYEYNLADLSCFRAQSSIWPLVLCSRGLQKTIGEIKKNKAKSKQRPYSDVCQRSSEASWWKVWMYLV